MFVEVIQVVLAKAMTNQDTRITGIPVSIKEEIPSEHTMFNLKGSSGEERQTCIIDTYKCKEAVLYSFSTMASSTKQTITLT